MTVKKGLKSLAESSPNFSNQALENAITDIQTKVNSDWVTKTFTLDTAIRNNTVLTTTQKNTILDDINYIPYLNIGRYLNDVIRHSNTILDATIIPITSGDVQTATFLEILQSVQSIQTLIPQLYGVTPAEKSRSVNDHLGSLNDVFLKTEDSSKPTFELITENLQQMMRLTNHSSPTDDVADGGDIEVAQDALLTFINSVVADSTDFQQTLDKHADHLKNQFTGLNLYLTNLGIFGNHADIQAIQAQAEANYNAVENQRLLEISNLSNIRTYSESLINNMGYTSLAEDADLRKLMANISGNANWQTYFNDYETNLANSNPIYETDVDSDKESVIDQILLNKGLPDVVDYVDLLSVANKAIKDDRIDTKDFESYTTEKIITKCCEQLGITTANNSIYNQSQSLLTNLNARDRQIIADALDANQDSNTLS